MPFDILLIQSAAEDSKKHVNPQSISWAWAVFLLPSISVVEQPLRWHMLACPSSSVPSPSAVLQRYLQSCEPHFVATPSNTGLSHSTHE